jgi:chaperonin cofactor prefoldin
LNIELDKITKERDDVKKELEVSLLRVSELETKQKRLIERLDKIESLILKEFGEPEG